MPNAVTRRLCAGALALVCLAGPVSPARAADLGEIGVTFASVLAGTALGTYLLPYFIPVAAPVVSTGYTVAANGVTALAGTAGALILANPPVAGAVIGMAAGVAVGLSLTGR